MTAAMLLIFLAWMATGFLALVVLAIHTRPRPDVDRDPAWDCADPADVMFPEDTP